MLTTLYIIRHAEPIRSGHLPYHVEPGPALSERGRLEAEQAAAFLADKGIEQLFVSPFARTRETAEVLVAQLTIPLTFTKLVQEHQISEQSVQVRARVRELLQSLDDSPFCCIGIVTHGSPMTQLLHELTNNQIDLSKHQFPHGNPAPTAGIWRAQRGNQHWSVQLVFTPPLDLSV